MIAQAGAVEWAEAELLIEVFLEKGRKSCAGCVGIASPGDNDRGRQKSKKRKRHQQLHPAIPPWVCKILPMYRRGMWTPIISRPSVRDNGLTAGNGTVISACSNLAPV